MWVGVLVCVYVCACATRSSPGLSTPYWSIVDTLNNTNIYALDNCVCICLILCVNVCTCVYIHVYVCFPKRMDACMHMRLYKREFWLVYT